MQQSSVHLKAEASWGNEGKQYIARIRGRSSKFTFDREFIGAKTGKRHEYSSIYVDDSGLYETCSIDRKGRKDRTFWVVLEYESNVRGGVVTEQEAMIVARGIGACTPMSDLVDVTEVEGVNVYGLPKIRIDAKGIDHV